MNNTTKYYFDKHEKVASVCEMHNSLSYCLYAHTFGGIKTLANPGTERRAWWNQEMEQPAWQSQAMEQ